ncbi:MAG TPA: C4-type zinc ribbon domain-containing protein [Longimicrobiales bacterium]|nr:C4-type zinc ribbon domain-containing protein [Longimicrobiales bacterium]
MHAQLEILLQIQDLKAQRRELADADSGGTMEHEEFNVDIENALQQLDEKIEEMKGGLEPRIRTRLDRIARAAGRPVVPLINGTCYGCFTTVATASLLGMSSNEQVHVCENCGRFLYSVAG